MNHDDRDDCDSIVVAGDDGEVLREIDVPPGATVDRSDDGSITSIVTADDDWQIHVAADTELGARIHRLARERGQSAEAVVLDAVHDSIESMEGLDTRADGDGVRVQCPNGHEFDRDEAAAATFDGSTAMYQCPSCGAWTEGPPPG